MSNFFKEIKGLNQKFKCYKSGDEEEKLDLTVKIHHEINAPAPQQDISALRELFPSNNDQVVDFYKTANGLKLYCNGDISGVDISPVDKIKVLNQEWKESFSDFDEEELYDFQKEGVAFGTISQSGNYFVLHEGKVYYSDHDGGDDEILGKDFNEFLEKTISEPADFLYDMGCYTRYSDGKTSAQWIPKEFSEEKG